MFSIKKRWLQKSAIVVIWLLLWQGISIRIDNSILMVGPLEVFGVLVKNLADASFWKTIFSSLIRITLGLVSGWLLGLLLAACSAGKRWVEDLLKPIMTMMKTVPVASFVVLFLIWFRSEYLAVVISLCVALPVVYFNTLEGIRNTDVKLLEMAKVFDLHPLDQFFYIYRPALRPFWESGLKVTVGMSWKAGVAAEVIGIPDFSIGEQLYMAKIYLDTAQVLAWTTVVILVSILCEKAGLALWRAFFGWQKECRGIRKKRLPDKEKSTGETILVLDKVSKAYGQNALYSEFSGEYKTGQRYYFESPSGSGKTTLFRMIAGLEKPDKGSIEVSALPAYVFQEDRLCEEYDAVKNVELVTGSRERALCYLLPLLEEEHFQKPCSTLSGGMKRRVAVARAFAAERKLLLLDEPYAGLDEENRQRMQKYMEETGAGKTLMIATHLLPE